MTVSGGSKVLYRVAGLQRGELPCIVRGIAQSRQAQSIIVVDCNNLMFAVGSKVKAVAEYLYDYAKTGTTILPACDNDVRPSVKQETIKRRANKEKARTKEYLLRREIRALKRRLDEEALTQQQRTGLLATIKKKETERKRKETASYCPAISNFANELEKELDLLGAHIPNEAGGSVLNVVIAQWQADTYMAGQIRNKGAVMVMSTDTDIPLFTGDACISIKGFKRKGFELVSTSKETLTNAMSYLGAGTKAKLIMAGDPIFEHLCDDRLRSLMMLIAGCDVYPSGLKNVGIATLSKKIEEFRKVAPEPEDESALYEHLVNLMKMEFKPLLAHEIKEVFADKAEADAFADMEAKEVVQAHVDALVYEPINEAGNETTYLGGDTPKELFSYCKDFAASDTSINRGPTIMKCKGVGGKEHEFLQACGHGTCVKCKHTLCKYCQATLGMDTNTYCLLCSATESLVPEVGTEAAKSIRDRRNRLRDVHQVDDVNNLDSDEVEDLLEVMDFVREYRAQGDTVPFPLYKTEEMEADMSTKWMEIAEIDLSGGWFIGDGNINQKYISGILNFFASIATFGTPGEKNTTWKKDGAIYDALPKMLIDFAAKSRVDSGYRLLSRCLRHALDSTCPSLESKSATLIVHGDEVGIRIKSNMPASMRKKLIYNPGIVFTANDVLCCECDCQCGSKKEERIVCVHNFPLIFLLLLLLMDKLAESLLLEFAACFRSDIWDDSLWSIDEMRSMKQSVVTLADAAGEDMSGVDLDNISLDELMTKFETGTERRKEWKQRLKSKPKPGDHCSIADIGKFQSTAIEAKMRTKRRSMEVDTQTDSNVDVVDNVQDNPGETTAEEANTRSPNYVDMELLLNASGCEDVLDTAPIGWKLLQMRARSAAELDARTLLQKSKDLREKWQELLRLGSKRTRRSNTDMDGHHRKKKHRVAASASLTQPIQEVHQTQGVHPTETAAVSELFVITPSPHVKKKTAQLRRLGMKLPSRPIQKNTVEIEKKQKISYRCCKKGCPHNNRDSPRTRFFGVPMRKPLKSNKPRTDSLINQAGAVLLRAEILDRTISDRSNVNSRCYVCEHHKFEEVSKSTTITLNNGKKKRVTYKLIVPSGDGLRTVPKTMSRGTGRDRAVRKILEDIEEDKEKRGDGWAMCTQQMSEESCKDQCRIPLNASVAAAADIPQTKGNADDFIDDTGKLFRATPVTETKTYHLKVDDSPVVQPGMADDEVKRRTGFPNEMTMLSYVIVACDGDVNVIKRRQTVLTWYEEWFMMFEYVWNRSLTRLKDVQKTFSNLREEEILLIMDAKLAICRAARDSWPMFASFQEDKTLQKDKWASRYHGMRPVMWDMTGISAYGFSNADWQRLTFSSYYGENCFKGGIFCQPCGWMGTINLWTGGVSDTDYNRRAGYLKKQQRFQENDLVEIDGERRVIRFLNIYDKGYRAKMAAWENGRQLVLQPDFKESDKRFNRDQTISSASVASDRGGNERVVNVSKRAGLISKGFQTNADAIRFNDIWLTWSFQANFMFDRVL